MTTMWETAGSLARGVWHKTSAWRRSARLMPGRHPLTISQEAVRDIRQAIPFECPARHCEELEPEEAKWAVYEEWTKRAMRETAIWNKNNVTRTQAYWNLYQEYPELHWALLAHMVSRNGGWSMTDLKGEWVPKLLPSESLEAHYELLETCNALIFQDAYPQLKLYAESCRLEKPLFELLPQFGVSAFMRPIWERFWEQRKLRGFGSRTEKREMPRSESALLTVALIVNEQHVIEGPVVRHPHYRDNVLASAPYQAMPLLQTNQIVFPMLPQGEHAEQPLKLAGKVLESFTDLDERIAFGKCLYGMLFGYPLVQQQVVLFAKQRPHTGSRADYWPQRFCSAPTRTDGQSSDCAAGRRWYSPAWTSVWPDRPLPNSPSRDWFSGEHRQDAFAWLTSPKPPLVFDMTYEHLLGQRKFQAAVEIAATWPG